MSTTEDQRIIIIFSMPFGPFSDYKYGANLPTYEVNVPLSGSVGRFGLLICSLYFKEEGNNINAPSGVVKI